MKAKLLKRSDYIDFIGLSLIGLYCLGSALWGSDFAEIHITLGFLNFPIFLGEILIAVCLLLLWCKHFYKPIVWKTWQQWLWIFLISIALKACLDFFHWGPLAFRNAAMYYYTVFALLSYDFYNPRYSSIILKSAIAVLLLFLTSIFSHVGYFWYGCMILFWVIISRINNKILQVILGGAFVVLGDYRFLFVGSRTTLVGSLAAVLFSLYIYIRYFLKMSWSRKAVIGSLLVLCLFLSFQRFADKSEVASLINLKEIVGTYQMYEQMMERRKVSHVPRVITPKLYNDNQNDKQKYVVPVLSNTHKNVVPIDMPSPVNPDIMASAPVLIKEQLIQATVYAAEKTSLSLASVPSEKLPTPKHPVKVDKFVTTEQSVVPRKSTDPARITVVKKDLLEKRTEVVSRVKVDKFVTTEQSVVPRKSIDPERITVVKKDLLEKRTEVVSHSDGRAKEQQNKTLNFLDVRMKRLSEKKPNRTVSAAEINTVFRIFIWQDMFKELVDEHAWFGVGFGKPQRSSTLEILNWGESEWSRDGWITPHNAYFHIIYRLGVIGIILIVILVLSLIRLTRSFIMLKSFKGVVLVSILVYWFVAANFLIILEFPHYAIPVWSLFGFLLAFMDHQKILK